MAIRLSGMSSGLDTESIVSELVKAYSTKTDKYKKEQTKLEWKQDAWKDLNAKIYSLYTNVGNFRYDSAYSLKKATISDATKATVSAAGSAINTSQKLNILSTAQACYITGAKVGKSGANGDTTLKDLGYTGADTSINILKSDGTKTSIKVSADTKIEDFTKELQNNGLNASFDATSGRFFVSAKETGSQADFALAGEDADGQNALTLLGLNTSVATTKEDGTIEFTSAGSYYKYYYDFWDTDEATTRANIQSYVDQFDADKAAYDTANRARSAAKNELKELQTAKADAQTKLDHYKVIDNLRNSVDGGLTDEEIANLTEDELKDTSKYGPLSASDIEKIMEAKETYGNLTDEEKSEDALKAAITTAEEAVTAKQEEVDAYTATMDEKTAAMDENPLESILRSSTGSIYGSERREKELNDFYAKVANAAEVATNTAYTTGGATKIAGTDAKIVLNGVTYTQSSNSFNINGLTINCTATTGEGDDKAITVSVATDTQAIYDKVKDLLSQYNSVINEMTKLYNADSAKDYEPLTDDEKDAMSEKEIEKWESKIKTALLRRDTTLNSVMSAMTNAMSRSYTINGKTFALSSFGIKTLGYFNSPENENYAYHIDGDEDDENTNGNEDKLMKAINEDPESLVEYLKELTKGLYTEIDNKMKSTTLSSSYKVYNDKEMTTQYNNYKKIISNWEEKVQTKEDYYYKKFTAMETAMAKLDSQTSSLSGLLGS